MPGGKRQKSRQRARHRADNRQVEQLDKIIKALFSVYAARLEILSRAGQNQQITDEQLTNVLQPRLACI